jgi:hypothetical protein
MLPVAYVDPWIRSVSTVHKRVATGRRLGHDVAVYGDPNPDLPGIKEELLLGVEQIRDQVGEVGFLGLWWDAVPERAHAMGPEPAYRLDTERFRQLRIRVEPPESRARADRARRGIRRKPRSSAFRSRSTCCIGGPELRAVADASGWGKISPPMRRPGGSTAQ